MNLATDDMQVTMCPQGKRGLRRALPVGERVFAPLIQEERLTALQEERLRKHNLAVALAQPHRGGSEDPRLAFPLGRFCASTWRNDHDFGRRMHAAGASYAVDIRALKVASGFHVTGSDREGAPPTEDQGLSPEEEKKKLEAMRANISALRLTLKRADELLLEIIPRLPRAMVRLCFDHDEPSIYDRDIIRNGLYRLALHYGHLERAINGA